VKTAQTQIELSNEEIARLWQAINFNGKQNEEIKTEISALK
jgi:hypothetical protein